MSAQNPSGSTSTDQISTSSPSRKRSGMMSTGMAVALAVVLLLIGIGGGYFLGMELNKSTTKNSQVTVTETGSSLLFPLMQSWGPNYTNYNGNVILSPAATGSGTGQADAEEGLVDI